MDRAGTHDTKHGRAITRKDICSIGLAFLAVSVVMWISACNRPPQTDQQLQQQAAQTTEQVKQEAKEAASDARLAAAQAERKVDAIAAGVKEGMNSDRPVPGTPETVDINSASAAQLATLPGISLARAQRIVAGRPFSTPHDLVSKGLISDEEYRRISARVVAD